MRLDIPVSHAGERLGAGDKILILTAQQVSECDAETMTVPGQQIYTKSHGRSSVCKHVQSVSVM